MHLIMQGLKHHLPEHLSTNLSYQPKFNINT